MATKNGVLAGESGPDFTPNGVDDIDPVSAPGDGTRLLSSLIGPPPYLCPTSTTGIPLRFPTLPPHHFQPYGYAIRVEIAEKQ